MHHVDLSPFQRPIPVVTGIELAYPRIAQWDGWWIPERVGPEAPYHHRAVVHLHALLEGFVARQGRNLSLARDLAIRFVEDQPRIGIAPDLCVLDPAPAAANDLASLCLWKPGHVRPPLCIEIVSHAHTHKNYATIHERYAYMHAAELVLFDPTLAGPKALGGPVPLQLWRRSESGTLVRVSHGAQPAYCQYLNAWLLPDRQLLEIAEDREGRWRWPSTVTPLKPTLAHDSTSKNGSAPIAPTRLQQCSRRATPGRPGTLGLTFQS
ncbi:MAG TPA: Uma2 family endonuclease [Polyangiaceae bacterium]|nr:Uma2 family endonuclease [Polyangiaceae bacterium]